MTYFYSFPNVCIRFWLNIELLPHLMKSPDIKSKILQSEANHQHLRTTPRSAPRKNRFWWTNLRSCKVQRGYKIYFSNTIDTTIIKQLFSRTSDTRLYNRKINDMLAKHIKYTETWTKPVKTSDRSFHDKSCSTPNILPPYFIKLHYFNHIRTK